MTVIGRPVDYDASYPPSLWGGGGGPVVPATGATAGIPGTWTPPGSQAPASVAALQGGTPNAVVASPLSAWTSGQYVQTRTAGAAGRATWTGTGWVGGAAPLAVEVEPPQAQGGGSGTNLPTRRPHRRTRPL